VPVAGRPSLAFVIDALEPLHIEELIIITGKLGEQMEEYVKEHYNYPARFIEQKVMRGQADALALAEAYVDGDLLTVFVDTLAETDLTVVNRLKENEAGVMFVAEVPDPSRFGIAVVGPDGYVTKVVEKPRDPESNLAVVGLYYFKDSKWLYRSIHKLMESGINRNGEYFLADALQVMIDDGAKFITQKVDVWEDTGTWDAVLHANRYLLRRMEKIRAALDANGFQTTPMSTNVLYGWGSADMLITLIQEAPGPLTTESITNYANKGWGYKGFQEAVCPSSWPLQHYIGSPCFHVVQLDLSGSLGGTNTLGANGGKGGMIAKVPIKFNDLFIIEKPK
jgi:dTDP-glucose pyrophosphorylase